MDFRKSVLGPIRSGKATAEHKILNFAIRHANQGGNKIEFIKKGGLDKYGSYTDVRDIEFWYKPNPNDKRTWTKWNWDKIRTQGAQSDVFKDIYKAERELNDLLAKRIIDPRTGKEASFGKVMTDTYSTQGGHTFGFKRTPYELDHLKGVLDDPFKNIRILPRRINQMLGQLKLQEQLFKTPGSGIKMGVGIKYIGRNKAEILRHLNYDINKPLAQLADEEVKLANRVWSTLKTNPELKGNVLKSGKEVFNEVYQMRGRTGPIDINFRTPKSTPLKKAIGAAKYIGKIGTKIAGTVLPVLTPAAVGLGLYDMERARAEGMTSPLELGTSYYLGPEVARGYGDIKKRWEYWQDPPEDRIKPNIYRGIASLKNDLK